MLLIILIIVAMTLCVFFINMFRAPKGNNISPTRAIVVVSERYNIDNSLLEYGGLDERTKLYIINLSPGESKGAAGRTFYVDPATGDVKE